MVLTKLKTRIQKTKSPSNIITALDIGTEYVKVLIGRVVGSGDRQTVEVLGIGRAHQRLTDMHSGAIADISGVVDNCDAALKEAEEMANLTAKDTVIGIAGELVKGETTTIKYRRPDSKRAIDMAELNQIIDKVKQRALERAQAQLSWESGVSEVEIKLVNAAIVNVLIDGYKVNNPLGFQGKDVNVQLFTAFAPMVHIGAIERVAYNLDLNLISVAAEPYAVAKSVGVEAGENFSAIFMDLGGGTSDVAVVNDGGVEGTKMFGIGGRSFTNTIANQLEVGFSEAEQLKLKLSDPNLEETERARIEKAVLPTVKVWLSGVELALSEFDNVDHLPSRVLLCGGGSGLPQIMMALKTDSWRRSLPFAKELKIAHISPNQVESVVDKTGKIDNYTYITPMGLLNVGLDALAGGSIKDTLMDKINKTLQA